jgi:tetratricopeptide (TPR) repeat protein
MTIRTLTLLLALWSAIPSAAFAQDDLQKAKELYAAADYEKALAVLTAVPNHERLPQVGQYRVFCLIALGQHEEAAEAIEDLLAADPLYRPDPAETSPRVVEAFSAARERALPGIARQMYVEAKAAHDRKERDAAVSGFRALLRTIDAAQDLVTEFEDLRVLADGFLALSSALPEPAPQVIPPLQAASSAGPTPAAPPAASVSTGPVVIKQDLPPWVANDHLTRRAAFTGTLRVRVSATGHVESAAMVRPVHPAYDGLLLRATESWLYQPATEDGVAVPADVVVQINLRPPQN